MVYTRDMKKHNRVEHPSQYVKEKLDVYKTLRKQCCSGMIELEKEIKVAIAAGTLEEAALDQHRKTRNFIKKKADSRDVNITATILGTTAKDPNVEGLDTWNAELFETHGQKCRKGC